MKIISPVDNLNETESLLAAGADELYGGYVPPDWKARFSLLTSINQRTFAGAQIESRDDLVAIVEKVHSVGGRFSLTLNAPFYSDIQLPLIVDYVTEAVAAGIDGIILADISLLRTLKKRFVGIEFHASTLAHIGNSLAAEIYSEAGIDRMIFPRHLPVSEMADIIRACPEMTYDAFFLVGKCPNTEGLCTFHHSSADKVWPCEIPYSIKPESAEIFSSAMELAIQQQASWSMTNRRHGCGLCALPSLLKAGLSGVKLVGRGAPAIQKINNIQMVKEFIVLSGQEPDFNSYRHKAVSAHKERFGADCSPNVCYYPEFYMAE